MVAKNITSFAMKEDSPTFTGSPHHSAAGEVLSPKNKDELMALLDTEELANIKYSAYRIASKLDILRSAMCMDEVKLGAVTGVFNQHGYGQPIPVASRSLGASFAALDAVLDKHKVNDLIADIFFSASKVRTYYLPTLDVSACSETALSMAMTVYGVKSNQCVSAKAMKVFFVLLSEGRLIDKYSYLFNDFANPKTKLLSRRSLSAILRLTCRLTEFLRESGNFGSWLVDAATNQCFKMFENSKMGITEDQFKRWVFMEPQVLVWMSTFYRLVTSKVIRHNVPCAVCKREAICGLRYQCLMCVNYDMCQSCFFTGAKVRHHKQSHPIQEYCSRSTRKDATRAMMKLLINNMMAIKRTRKRQSNRYMPHDSKLESKQSRKTSIPEEVTEVIPETPKAESDDGMIDAEKILPTPAEVRRAIRGRKDEAKLFNSIVIHLEEQNNQMLSKLTGTDEEQSCQVMQKHLEKLKTLVQKVFSEDQNGDETVPAANGTLSGPSLIESTPLHHVQKSLKEPLMKKKLMSRIDLDKNNFSPIVLRQRQPGQRPISEVMEPIDEEVILNSDSFIVDTLLNVDENNEEKENSTVSHLSLKDLTSLLVKTGRELPLISDETDNAVREKLQNTSVTGGTPAQSNVNEELMEELETLMLRLESVFKSYHDRTIVSVHQKQTQREFESSTGLQQIVSEIADQIHTFNFDFQNDFARIPSVRSDGDGLSSPEPPLTNHRKITFD